MKRFLKGALLLLLATVSHASSPFIYKGSVAKNLTSSGIEISNTTTKQILDIAVDPTAGGGVVAAVGSVALRSNSSVGEVWLKVGSGNTAWVLVNGKLSPALTSAHIFVGDGSNLAADVAVTGDIAITNAGVTSIASGVIVNADVNASAAVAITKLAIGTANQIPSTNAGATANEFRSLSAGTSGTDFAVAFGSGTITLNLPTASASNRGALSTTDWSTFNGKLGTALTAAHVFVGNVSNVATDVAVSGDISMSNAGATAYAGTVPLNKGGTGQTTKAPAFDALSPMTTGGDLIYGGASGTGTRLANGSAGTVLTSAGTTLPPTWSAITVTPVNSFYRSAGGNGYGSTGTKIRKYNGTQTSNGSDITYASNPSNNGDTFTINTAGIYSVVVVDAYNGVGTGLIGITVDVNSLTTNVNGITYANGYRGSVGSIGTSNDNVSITWIGYLALNAVVRCQGTGDMNATTDQNSFIEIRRIL